LWVVGAAEVEAERAEAPELVERVAQRALDRSQVQQVEQAEIRLLAEAVALGH
jgi:hypothetical protein